MQSPTKVMTATLPLRETGTTGAALVRLRRQPSAAMGPWYSLQVVQAMQCPGRLHACTESAPCMLPQSAAPRALRLPRCQAQRPPRTASLRVPCRPKQLGQATCVLRVPPPQRRPRPCGSAPQARRCGWTLAVHRRGARLHRGAPAQGRPPAPVAARRARRQPHLPPRPRCKKVRCRQTRRPWSQQAEPAPQSSWAPSLQPSVANFLASAGLRSSCWRVRWARHHGLRGQSVGWQRPQTSAAHGVRAWGARLPRRRLPAGRHAPCGRCGASAPRSPRRAPGIRSASAGSGTPLAAWASPLSAAWTPACGRIQGLP
mmetsp:Transcript_57673/g.163768  ORF Transcript_57673/g.163768 Transcript_57673/m.163768 type:complete len:315 (+) Transcript_57673:1694-2638(+)